MMTHLWTVRPTLGATPAQPETLIRAAKATDATAEYRARFGVANDALVSAIPVKG